MRSRSRSRSPLPLRGSSRHARPSGSGERCHHCARQTRRHNPGPESPLPHRSLLERIIVNPHGRKATGPPLPLEDVKIPRRPGEGKRPMFDFFSPPTPPPLSPNRGPKVLILPEKEPQSAGPSRPRPRDHSRVSGDTRQREEERRPEREYDSRRRHESRSSPRERQKEEQDNRDQDTEVSKTGSPQQPSHENGATMGPPSEMRPQWRPPRPMFPMYPQPFHPIPPPWAPYGPPPPRMGYPRGPIRGRRY